MKATSEDKPHWVLILISKWMIIIGLILWSSRLQAQNFLNLSFEYASPRGFPLAWEVNEGKGAPSSIRVDSTQSFDGRKSLIFTAQQAPMLLAGLFFSVERLKGHTLTLTGQIKIDSLQDGEARWFHYDYGRRSFGFSDQAVTKTTNWQPFRYSFNVPEDAQGEGIVPGLKVNGTGKVYLDAVRVELDGQELLDTPPSLKPLSTKQQAWLNRTVVPLRSLDPNDPVDDLTVLKRHIGPSRLVGLGENSHGSGSLFQVKHRLIQYLVEKMGFTVIAMEAPAPEADLINRYVQGGEGSPAQVTQLLGFKSWQTKEVLSMIEWMRAYNQSHPDSPVEFRGFDLQSQEIPLQNLARYGEKNDSTLLELVNKVTATLRSKPLNDSLRTVAYQQVQVIIAHLKDQKQSSENKGILEQLQHDADILAQSIALPFLKNRREWMAQNIRWLVDQHPKNVRMVIWAANGHISKQGVNMGHYLHDWYGKEYFAIGSTFNQGTYSIYGSPGFFAVETPYPGTYEYLLNQCQYPDFILNLSAIQKQDEGHWIKQQLGFRFLETETQLNQFRSMSITEHFDALIHLRTSIRSTYINP
ncbi:erythromycin esterase family protein [Telluribacter humicola]|uniref:erythromycin esterase family protein n=1 Tax=Telluribacter humicola TaxID=1720261 RepID=UPI001A95D3AF|nr:erythromycin esterase family protein [Telluribacter humicola]